MQVRHILRSLGAAALVYLGVLGLSAAVVDWQHDDPTDEVEWVTISILHWRQVTQGGAPAGLELERGEWRTAGPWRSGAQRTMFGYPSANLPKLVWGGVLAAGGFREASPIVFDVFEQYDPAAGAAAERELRPALRVARGVVFAVFALCGALLVWAALELRGGAGGRACAALALALWLASPVTRQSATFVRGDYFMLAWVLAAVVYALRARVALSGALAARSQWRAACVLGVFCGLALASKLNGILLAPAAALWIVCLWAGVPRPTRASFVSGALVPLGLAGTVTCLIFYALHPRLWSEPLTGLSDMLERWRWMREFLQEDWARRAQLRAARDLREGWSLFTSGLLAREDPWRALTGLSLRWLVLPSALLGLAVSSLRRRAGGSAPERARILLLAALVTALGTAAWLPIDWPRYWIPAVALAALVEAWALVALAELTLSRAARRSRPSEA